METIPNIGGIAMRNRVLICFAFISLSISAFAQFNYSDYTERDKKTFYFDDFTNNVNRWWEGNSPDALGIIENGCYTLEWKSDATPIWNSFNTVPINFSKDYEIETFVKQSGGTSGNLFGLTFNRSNIGECGFVVNTNGGSVVFQDRKGEERRFIKDGGENTPDVTIAANNFNKLTIRKVGQKFYFFINEKLIKEGYVFDFSSTAIGFQLWYKTKISVDYLRVSYIEPAPKEVVSTVPVNAATYGGSDVDSDIPVTNATNDKTFAVIIGNEIYAKEIQVKHAVNDAQTFKQYLHKTLGVPTDNVQYLENATYGQILDAMKWISDVTKVYNGEAKVIFYYAGHGMPDEQTKSAYILPVDGNSQNPATAVKLADLYAKLSEYPSESVTVFLDACFSGATRENSGAMLSEARGVKVRPKSDMLSGNLVVFSAATGDETAFPYVEKKHGLFTYYLLKKLKESKGSATLNELSQFVITNVTRQSVVVNKKAQTPQVNSGSKVQSAWQGMRLK